MCYLFYSFSIVNLPDLQESSKSAIPRATVKQMYFQSYQGITVLLKFVFVILNCLLKPPSKVMRCKMFYRGHNRMTQVGFEP